MSGHVDSRDAGRQRIEHDRIARRVGPAVVTRDLPRLEVLHCGSKHSPVGIEESHIKMCLSGVGCLQSLQHVAFYDQRTLLALEPDFLDDDRGGVPSFEDDMRHIRWSPKWRGTAHQQQAGYDGEDWDDFHVIDQD